MKHNPVITRLKKLNRNDKLPENYSSAIIETTQENGKVSFDFAIVGTDMDIARGLSLAMLGDESCRILSVLNAAIMFYKQDKEN